MKIINAKFYRGFTLIEVMVVSILIVILATIGVASYSSINRQAKDTKRIQDIQQARTMVESFKQSNTNGSYPATLSELGSDYTLGAFKDSKGTSYSYSVSPSGCSSSSGTPCTDFLFSITLEDGSCYFTKSSGSGTQSSCPTLP